MITVNAEMAKDQLNPDDPLYEDLNEIINSGEKTADLTRQLLAFSRKQTLQPKVLNLSTLVNNLKKMLLRLIGEDIDLSFKLQSDLWNVNVDPGQIEQVIINLAVNARDAMPMGGKLTFETVTTIINDEYIETHPEATPGEYVMVGVTDNGSGISEDVKSKMFEPFYTTKDVGKGTGLGLSTVYGIVKQSEGFIYVYSVEGEGTSFKIYLPRVIAEPDELIKRGEISKAPRGSETVLIVEDEAGIRKVVIKILNRQGYQVLEAENGGSALALCEKLDKPVDLLVTDVIMPIMGGAELKRRLHARWPDLKVLFMSGYTENAIVHHGVLKPGIPYIQKPFSPMDFLERVRKVLNGPPGSV